MHDGLSMHGGLVEHFPFRNDHRFVLEMSPFVPSLRRRHVIVVETLLQ